MRKSNTMRRIGALLMVVFMMFQTNIQSFAVQGNTAPDGQYEQNAENDSEGQTEENSGTPQQNGESSETPGDTQMETSDVPETSDETKPADETTQAGETIQSDETSGSEVPEIETDYAGMMLQAGVSNDINMNMAMAAAAGSFHVVGDFDKSKPAFSPGSKYLDIFRVAGHENDLYYYSFILRWVRDDPEPRRYAYCFEIGKSSGYDIPYGPDGHWKANAEYTALAYAMTNGAQRVGQTCVGSEYSTGNWWVDYAVTQAAAHLIIDHYDAGNQKVPFNEGDLRAGSMTYWASGGTQTAAHLKQDAVDKAKKLYRDAVAYGDELRNGYLDRIDFEMTTSSNTLKLDGSYYVSEPIQITPKVFCPDGKNYQSKFDKSSLKVTLQGAPSGATLEKIGDMSYRVKIPKNNVTAGQNYSMKVVATGYFDRQKVVNYKCSNTTLQAMGFWEVIRESVSDSTDLKLSVPNKLMFGVEKVWEGGQPESGMKLKVGLYRKIPGGEYTFVSGSEKTLSALNSWKIEAKESADCWKGLPIADAQGRPYTYCAMERSATGGSLTGWEHVYTESATSGTILKITNIKDKIELTVKKVWTANKVPKDLDSIHVTLWRKTDSGTNEMVPNSGKTLYRDKNWTLPDSDNWKVPKYDAKGNLYKYYVKETTVPSGYRVELTTELSQSGQLTVTNTREDLELWVRKVWQGDTEADRPQNLYVSLWRKTAWGTDEKVASSDKTLNKGNSWSNRYDTWIVPKYDEAGHLYTYYVKENIPSGYNFIMSTERSSNGEIVITNELNKKAELTVLKKDADTGNLIGGAEFELRRGSTVIGGVDNGSGVYTYTGLTNGDYVLTEERAPNGYKLPSGSFTFTVSGGKITNTKNNYGSAGSYNSGTFTYTLENEPDDPPPPDKPRLTVKKIDENSDPLYGAVFRLTKNSLSGTEVDATSSGGSTFTYENLEDGIYYLKETGEPNGYKLPSGYAKFEVSNGGITMEYNGYGSLGTFNSGTFTYTLENEPDDPPPPDKPKLVVKKVDENREPLYGAKFRLTKGSLSGTEVYSTSSGGSTFTYEDLEDGTYYLKEIGEPNGYKLPSGYAKFEVSNGKITMEYNGYGSLGTFSGGTFTYTLENEPDIPDPKTATLKINKINGENDPLYGARFKLVKNGTTTITGTGNGVGSTITYSDLTDGDYVLTEEEPPDGYKIPKTGSFKFSVSNGNIIEESNTYYPYGDFNEDTFVYRMINEPEKPDFRVKKYIAGTTTPLSGATFKLTRNGVTVNPASGQGTAVVDYKNLDDGSYVLKETKQPSGYKLPNGSFTFTIKNGEITTWNNGYGSLGSFYENQFLYELKNEKDTPKYTKFIVKKEDGKGNPLSGAKFKLVKDGMTTIAGTGNGTSTVTYSNLSDGRYRLTEEAAPTGYKLPADSYFEFTVRGGEIISTEDHFGDLGDFSMSTLTYTLDNEKENAKLIVKKVDMDYNALRGARFKLLKDGTTTMYGSGNGSSDIITFSNLTDGNYVLTEEEPPTGYQKPKGSFTFTVSNGKIINDRNNYGNYGAYNGGTFTFTMKNDEIVKRAEFVVKKEDTKGNPLTGAGFLLKKDGQDIMYGDGNGAKSTITYSNLSDGQYELTEVMAPDGYKLPEGGFFRFTIADGEIISTEDHFGGLGTFEKGIFTYTLENEPDEPEQPRFSVTKVNMSGYEITGAEFELRREFSLGREEIIDVSRIIRNIYYYDVLEDGTYHLEETKAPAGFEKPEGVFTFRVAGGKITEVSDDYGDLGTFDGTSFNYTLKNKPSMVDLVIRKTDMDGNLIPGAKFSLTYESGKELELIDNGDGTFTSPNVTELQLLRLEEVEAPDGYELPIIKSFGFRVYNGKIDSYLPTDHITVDKNTLTITWRNKPEPPKPGEFKVKKTDMDGNPLTGAVFKLTRDSLDGEVVAAPTVEGNMYTWSGLKDGTYYLKETTAPNGHEIPDGSFVFKVTGGKVTEVDNGYVGLGTFDGDRFMYTLKNEKQKGKLIVYKTDMSGMNMLDGAKFELRKDSLSGTLIPEKQNTTPGVFSYSKLEDGRYYLRETEAPDGYKLPPIGEDDAVIFEVKDGQTSMLVNCYAGLGSFNDGMYAYALKNEALPDLSVVKIDMENNPLSGAEFELRKGSETGDIVKAQKDGDHRFIYKDLEDDYYYLRETKAPDGYEAEDGIVEFRVLDGVITKESETVEAGMGTFSGSEYQYTYTLKNRQKTYDLQVNKTDTSGTPITDAEFKLTKGSLDGEAVEADAGYSTFVYENLTEGTYYLKEIKAPEGYVCPEGYVEIIIEDGEMRFGDNLYGNLIKLPENGQPEGMLTLTMENKEGMILPDTGGKGRTQLYMIGIFITGLGFTGILAASRRKRAKH